MAASWLDSARYADTNGYQTDAERYMWRWRDWVIDAYNRNLPFDQFALQQIAGDMLPRPTLDQRIATGFNRNHRGNGEGGIIPEEYDPLVDGMPDSQVLRALAELRTNYHRAAMKLPLASEFISRKVVEAA